MIFFFMPLVDKSDRIYDNNCEQQHIHRQNTAANDMPGAEVEDEDSDS